MKRPIWMLLIGVIYAGVLLSGFRNLHQTLEGGHGLKPETPTERHERLKSEVPEAIRKHCTNSIVGLRTIINTDTASGDADPNHWYGWALVEYFNQVGGVERREIKFKFMTFYSPATRRDLLACVVDRN